MPSVKTDADEFDGRSEVIPGRSLVDSHGRPNESLIDGLILEQIRPVATEGAHVTEVIRSSWPAIRDPITQVYVDYTEIGAIRGWSLHERNVDRLFVASGMLRIVCFDARAHSPTHGHVTELRLSDRAPALLIIPQGIYHGWKNIGSREAVLVSMPSVPFDYTAPDALKLPYDSDPARSLIPYTW